MSVHLFSAILSSELSAKRGAATSQHSARVSAGRRLSADAEPLQLLASAAGVCVVYSQHAGHRCTRQTGQCAID